MYAAWQMQQLLQVKIQPRKSLLRFLLFLMVNIGVVFIDIVLFDLFCEMFITILYTMRNKAQCAISLTTLISSLRCQYFK